jgi:hypothetical protein
MTTTFGEHFNQTTKSGENKSTNNEKTDDFSSSGIIMKSDIGIVLFGIYSPYLISIIVLSIYNTMYDGFWGAYFFISMPVLLGLGITLLVLSSQNFKKKVIDKDTYLDKKNAPYFLAYGILSILLFIFLIIKLIKNNKDYDSFVINVLEAVKIHNMNPINVKLDISKNNIAKNKLHMNVQKYIEYLINKKIDP